MEWSWPKLACAKIWRYFAKQVLSYGSKCACEGRLRSRVKVICKGHRIVKSDLRLLLLSMQKKFCDDATARFCSGVDNSKRRGKKATNTITI